MSDERLEQGFGSDDLPDARARAWYASGTCVVDGGEKNRPVEPRHRLRCAGSGGSSRAASLRGSARRRSSVQEPARGDDFSGGQRGHDRRPELVREPMGQVQVNAIRERVDDVERNPVPDGAAFWSQHSAVPTGAVAPIDSFYGSSSSTNGSAPSAVLSTGRCESGDLLASEFHEPLEIAPRR